MTLRIKQSTTVTASDTLEALSTRLAAVLSSGKVPGGAVIAQVESDATHNNAGYHLGGSVAVTLEWDA